MKIEDLIYGEEEIKEEILIDLINSKELQRLKGVSQLGLPDKYSLKKGFSRYEHSLGVLILLRRLGASLDEQIAGLLHDVNHLAFSHIIDWVFGDPSEEDYQDKHFFSFLKNSSIPNILEKYGFPLNTLEHFEKYTLLEQKAPRLCADRVDYSLRELATDGFIEISKKIFMNLKNFEGTITIKDLEIGKLFYDKYSHLNKYFWSGEEFRTRYFIFASILKKSFEKNLLIFEDLVKSEEEIINILLNSKDEFIMQNLNLLVEGFDLIEDGCGIELKTKFRYIDPEILFGGNYEKLSNLSKEYQKIIEEEKIIAGQFKKVRIIPKNNLVFGGNK